MIAVGQRIGPYEIRQRLGRGGVGDVFAGVDRELERPVAIKALRPEFSQDPGFLGRFRAEAANLARLNHPNINTLYALHREGDDLFMILELVCGRTLEEIIHAAGRVREQDSLALAAQAVDGLSYAHKTGVVHRDLKPANLMVTADGVLKIMDFGIARMRGSVRLTRQGHIVGTLAYMAPEQIRGLEADARADIYSLAIVLYELLSGNTPFVSDSEYELLRLQVEAAPTRLVDYVPGLRPEVESAILRALAKDPAARFPTMEAFGQSLSVLGMRAEAVARVHRRFPGVAGQTVISTPGSAAGTSENSGRSRTRLVSPQHPSGNDQTRPRLASHPSSPAASRLPWRLTGAIGHFVLRPSVLLAAVALLVASGVAYIALDLLSSSSQVVNLPEKSALPPKLEASPPLGPVSDRPSSPEKQLPKPLFLPSDNPPAVVPSPIMPLPPLLPREEGHPPPPKFAEQAPKKAPGTRRRPSQSQTPKKAPLDPSAGGKGWVIDRGK